MHNNSNINSKERVFYTQNVFTANEEQKQDRLCLCDFPRQRQYGDHSP